MITIEINPKNLKTDILKNLNICFPNWGNEETYKFYFERKITHLSPDIILVRNDKDEIIAGSAISYRKIKLENNITHNIGIMTGSWTLPTARGLGCFTKMIELSKEICKEKQVEFLTAFVTEDNASYRRLKGAGSICLPANNYFFDKKNENQNEILIKNLVVKEINWKDIHDYSVNMDISIIDRIGFNYNLSSFENQYIKRLNEVRIYIFKKQLYIIEIGNIIKILFVSKIISPELKEMMVWLNQNFEKKIMLFCSQPEYFNELNNFLEIKAGFFTFLSTAGENIPVNLNIQLGDKV